MLDPTGELTMLPRPVVEFAEVQGGLTHLREQMSQETSVMRGYKVWKAYISQTVHATAGNMTSRISQQ